MSATISHSKVELTQKEKDNVFAISCFQQIMKSNWALHHNYKEMIIEYAQEQFIKGQLSHEFLTELKDVN